MNGEETIDPMGRDRTHAFAFQPGRGRWAILSLGGVGAFAMLAPFIDPAEAGFWMVLAGLFLVAIAVWLLRMAGQATVLVEVGLEGLNLPLAFARPLPWSSIWRMRRTRRKRTLSKDLIHLKVELSPGVSPDYKRSVLVWPVVDAMIARKWGLTIPLHNLSATEDEILASIERFKPVQRVV